MDSAPFIVSLALDADSFAALDALRTRHFPPERLKVGAHITLFHALPAARETEIRAELERVARLTARFPVAFPGVFLLGGGVAVDAPSPSLVRLREFLADRWRPFLTPQDAAPYRRPHVTVQNKVAPDAARALFHELDAAWQPMNGTALGLNLWRYRGGSWDAAGSFDFAVSTAPLPQ